jgi:hypothetical protein
MEDRIHLVLHTSRRIEHVFASQSVRHISPQLVAHPQEEGGHALSRFVRVPESSGHPTRQGDTVRQGWQRRSK